MKLSALIKSLLSLVLFPLIIPSAHAFGSKNVFPQTIKNECSASVHESKDKKFLVATVNVLIDLKNSENEVVETAYIYLSCKGKTEEYRPGTLPEIIGTTCVGIRMNGLKKSSLSSPWIFPIFPDEIKIISRLGEKPVILEWDERSKFVINSGKSFEWKLKSAISEKIHSGISYCQ